MAKRPELTRGLLLLTELVAQTPEANRDALRGARALLQMMKARLTHKPRDRRIERRGDSHAALVH